MLNRLTKNQLNIVIGLVMLLTTFLGYYYIDDDFLASAMWPAVGFAVGFYYVYENKVLPGLILGILVANLIARFTLLDEEVYITILFSIVFSFANLIEAFLFNKLMVIPKKIRRLSLKTTLLYIHATIASSMTGAIISVSIILISNHSTNFFTMFTKWAFGDFLGILIFGTAIIYSFHSDKAYVNSTKKNIQSTIFLLLFILFSYAIFSNTIEWLTFQSYSFLFMIFFFTAAFIFSCRMILTLDILYVLIYQIFLINSTSPNNIGLYIFSLNLLLLILSCLALITRFILITLEDRNILLKESNIKINSLLDSTNSLLKLSDKLLRDHVEIDESYLIQMFNIATTVFENFEYATCYINSETEEKFIAGYGYDIAVLNRYFKQLEGFEWNIHNPIICTTPDENIKEILGNKFDEFTRIYPEIKQSLRFNIFVEKGVIGGMSFDIMKNSDKTFTKFDLDTFQSYQKLMNSFYEIHYLNYKNNNLKNDIVLSLIRTLELYDHYTGGHSEEVAFLAGEIASRMKLNEKDVNEIYWAGIVHDIGKIGIPSDIINKPDKLTLEEYRQIQDHPVFGYQILSKSEDLKEIALLVKFHHEWWNGEGYPDKIKGDDIPLGAQILAICDAVSTMATKRPYTLVKSSREIIKELQLYNGIQFSPKPTKAMIEFIEEGLLD